MVVAALVDYHVNSIVLLNEYNSTINRENIMNDELDEETKARYRHVEKLIDTSYKKLEREKVLVNITLVLIFIALPAVVFSLAYFN